MNKTGFSDQKLEFSLITIDYIMNDEFLYKYKIGWIIFHDNMNE